jgi:carboxyl-terminal processing protease
MPSPAGLAAALAVPLALAAGLYLGGHPDDLPGGVRDVFVDESASLQARAKNLIQDNYARPVSEEQLEDGSIRGMVGVLEDRFSHYFTPRQNRIFRESIGGEFSGVGMTVVEHRRGLVVTGVFEGSPAERAGIGPGTLITKVDSKSIAGESSDIATARIKGRPGTFVRLTIVPRKGARGRTVRIKREQIKIPVVEARIARRKGRPLAVITVASFTSGVHGQLRMTIRDLRRRGADRLLLDLRQNGGGLLDEAVLVSSLFVPDGTIVSTRGRKRGRKVLKAVGGTAWRKPVVVLVDRGSASASEIVTAALNERVGAKVVGARTFGKGVFGQLFSLPNGGAIDLTLGNFYTPKGRNLGGKGIEPDVRARDDPSTPRRDEALERALSVLASQPVRDGSG